MATTYKRILSVVALSLVACAFGCTYNEDDLRPAKKQPVDDAGVLDSMAMATEPDLPAVVADAGSSDGERLDATLPEAVDSGIDLAPGDVGGLDAAADRAIDTVAQTQVDAADDQAIIIDASAERHDADARRIDTSADGASDGASDGGQPSLDAQGG
jgi:hypothetical protein